MKLLMTIIITHLSFKNKISIGRQLKKKTDEVSTVILKHISYLGMSLCEKIYARVTVC